MEFWIGLLAASLSIALGIIVGFLTREFVVGAACAVAAFAVVVFGLAKLSRKEAQVRRERPDQQSNLRGDATKLIEAQMGRGEVGVPGAPKKPDEVMVECEGATRLQLENLQASYRKGIALYELQRRAEALQIFDEAIKLTPDDPEAWYYKGLCLLELEKSQEAVVAFKRAASLQGRT